MSREVRLFPLYLTPLELYMYYEHRDTYPMTFVNQIQLSGAVDQAAMDAALEEVIVRHPLLTAIVQPAKRKRLCWVDSKTKPVIDHGSLDEPLKCDGGEPIDISRQIGTRLWLRAGENTAELTMQNHHACADGIAAQRFLAELLASYGRRTAGAGERPELGDLQPALLRDRLRTTTGLALTAGRSALTLHSLKFATRFFGAFNCTLAPEPGRSRYALDEFEFPGIAFCTFNKKQHQVIREAALQRGVTLNDLLLALLFKTCYDWNRERGTWATGKKLRVLMPCDLRGKEGYELPAGNLTSLTFLTRRAAECGDVEALLHGIRNETAAIKHSRRDTEFSDTLVSAVAYPGLLPLMVIGERCLATVVLTNLGDPTRRFTARFPRRKGAVIAGNLQIEGFTGVPPMRPKTRGAFAVFTYRRELRICLRADPNFFRLSDSRNLLDCYARTIREFAGVTESED